MKQSTWHIYLYQRLTTHKTKLRFLVVGCVGFACNAIILLIVTHFGVHKIPAEIISMIVSLQLTFILHDKWTYVYDHETKNYTRSFKKRYLLYLASNSFGSIMTVVMFSFFSLLLGNLLSLAIASVVTMFWNYAMNKIVIWRHT